MTGDHNVAARTLPEPSGPVSTHPELRRKADAIVALLKPNVTAAHLDALTRPQWQELGERAGVGKPSPLVQGIVRAEVAKMRGVLDA